MNTTSRPVSLTGIKPTGIPHLGNLVGAIRPALRLVNDYEPMYFIADYHALTTVRDPEQLAFFSRSVAATWLACGLDAASATFYRQSDVPEIFELSWVMACLTPKGLLNRAHAYKAAQDRNREAGTTDLDSGVNMGLFNYPGLMAVDILAMAADVVPVGRDQVQHVEIARDIAGRFNMAYGERFELRLPRHLTSDDEDEHTLPGLDGRKMSKSYGNTIPLFSPADELRKLVKRIKTDSVPVEAPKDPESSLLFKLYREFATPAEADALRARMLAGGLGWGEMKEIVFAQLDAALSEPRDRYARLMADPAALDSILHVGAAKARDRASVVLASVRRAIGIG